MPDPTGPLPRPYLDRKNGDLITAEDWNEIQQLGRAELYGRAAIALEASLAGVVSQVDGAWVVVGDKTPAEGWTALPGLTVELKLPWDAVVQLRARGRIDAEVGVAFWVAELADPERECPARVSPGLAQKAEVLGYGALPWAERVAAWSGLMSPLAAPADLNLRTPCGASTSPTLLLLDTLWLPAGAYELSLRSSGEGTPRNIAFTAVCTPTLARS